MKYLITGTILLFTVIASLISCTNKNGAGLISPTNLITEEFTINTGKDTVLQTKNGALLNIPSGTLVSKNGKATLAIKEAYSMQQIIEAGLFTTSNGKPLSSGGMIYINAAEGQDVTIKGKIEVAIPTDFIQPGMQVYKGEEKEDGSVNWINPEDIANKELETLIDTGKILFQQQCMSCHTIGQQLTGPDVAHFLKRFPDWGEEGSYMFHHPISYFLNSDTNAHYDQGINCATNFTLLYNHNIWEKSPAHGVIFHHSTEETFAILRYIQNESDRRNLPLPSHTYLKDCVDSCIAYNKLTGELQKLKNKTEQERNRLIEANGDMVIETHGGRAPSRDTAGWLPKVEPENFKATYYQFTIKTFGWFNIDMLLDDVNNDVLESELFVRIKGKYIDRVKLYLAIPSVKVFDEGGASDIKGQYAFFLTTGKIPLPQNTKAYIIAVSEQNEEIAFAIKEFTTSIRQSFDIALQSVTKEEFNQAMKKIDAANLSITVNDSKNADSIRITDKEIKNINQQLEKFSHLKPVRCSCDCAEPSDESAVALK